MTQILLISDSDRVTGLFDDLAKRDSLALQVATTLNQVEEEIQAATPDFTFVQSRLSGFSADILLRHLKKHLPSDAKIVLLAADAAEMAQARKQTKVYLDLALSDERLAGAVKDILEGNWRSHKAVGDRTGSVQDDFADAVAAVPAPGPEEGAEPAVPPRKPAQGAPAPRPRPAKASGKSATGKAKGDKPEGLKPETPDSDAPTAEPARGVGVKPAGPEAAPASTASHTSSGRLEAAMTEAMKPGTSETADTGPGAGKADADRIDAGKDQPQEPVLFEPDRKGAEGEKAGSKGPVKSFAEIMDLAAQGEPAAAAGPQVEERVTLSKPSAAPDWGPDPLDRVKTSEDAGQDAVQSFASALPLAEAIRRSQKRESRRLGVAVTLALVVAAVGVAGVSFLAGKKDAPPDGGIIVKPERPKVAPAPAAASKTPPAPTAAPPAHPSTQAPVAQAPAPPAKPAAGQQAAPAKPAPQQPPAAAVPQAAKPAVQPGTKAAASPAPLPAAKPEAKPQVKAESKPAAPGPQVAANPVPAPKPEPTQAAKPEAKPVAKGGLTALPSVLAGTKPDESYAKGHPGWQRFQGVNFEYKLFREGQVFKALQVLPRTGKPVPDQVFTKALTDFAGSGSYRVKTTGVKGKYLVEEGEASGGVGVTLYRNKEDHRMKAFVLYFR